MMGMVASTEAARCRIWFASFKPPVTVNPASPAKLLVVIFVPSFISSVSGSSEFGRRGVRTTDERGRGDELLDAAMFNSSVESVRQ